MAAFQAILGLANTGSHARRVAVVIAATSMLAVPFVLPADQRILRGFLGLGMAWCFLRQIDLAAEHKPMTPIRRAMHASLMMEFRHTPRIPPRFDVPSFVRLLGLGGMTLAAFWVVALIPSDARDVRLLVRGFAA